MAKGPLERQRQLKFEKKNKNLVKVPQYARIQKRPIPHAPVASPYAGASVPKIVYVSTKSPFMSAVKRVQKLLRCAEKRATRSVELSSRKISEEEKKNIERLAEAQEKLQAEQVFIKATGRAIEKALSVGKWFEEKEAEYSVVVKTGSVLVVDDIVTNEKAKQTFVEKIKKRQEKTAAGIRQEQEGKDELQVVEQEHTGSTTVISASTEATAPAPAVAPVSNTTATTATKKKRKRVDPDFLVPAAELPESRTRWIKMVEIAVTLK